MNRALPEGFDPAGPSSDRALVCELSRVEVMGRDTSIVFTHPALDGLSGRAIVDAEEAAGLTGDIQKLVDQLPDNIKSKVEPLIRKFLGGDSAAGFAGPGSSAEG